MPPIVPIPRQFVKVMFHESVIPLLGVAGTASYLHTDSDAIRSLVQAINHDEKSIQVRVVSVETESFQD